MYSVEERDAFPKERHHHQTFQNTAREKDATRFRGRGMKKKKKKKKREDETSKVFFVPALLFFLTLAFVVCLALPRYVALSKSSFFVRATTTTDDEKDWKTRRSNCAAKGFDDPRAIRCEYCRFALKEALDDEEITRECLECCTETTTGGDPDANDGVQLMMSSNRFDRATITACS